VHRIGATIAAALAAATVVTAALAAGSPAGRSATGPAWARALAGVRPYLVEHEYGTSRGLTCDLAIYTTNPAALDGRASLRPGDVTATVCIVRRAGR
jgi:hypothetical protein